MTEDPNHIHMVKDQDRMRAIVDAMFDLALRMIREDTPQDAEKSLCPGCAAGLIHNFVGRMCERLMVDEGVWDRDAVEFTLRGAGQDLGVLYSKHVVLTAVENDEPPPVAHIMFLLQRGEQVPGMSIEVIDPNDLTPEQRAALDAAGGVMKKPEAKYDA